MSHPEIPLAPDCVPVSKACTHSPADEITPQWEDPTAENGPAAYDPGPQPATGSPYELVIAEPTLVAMLIRQYGWICTAPGKIQRYRVK